MTKDERERTSQLLQRLAQDHAVLVVEHDMEFSSDGPSGDGTA